MLYAAVYLVGLLGTMLWLATRPSGFSSGRSSELQAGLLCLIWPVFWVGRLTRHLHKRLS